MWREASERYFRLKYNGTDAKRREDMIELWGRRYRQNRYDRETTRKKELRKLQND
jgi:hypothetical protein